MDADLAAEATPVERGIQLSTHSGGVLEGKWGRGRGFQFRHWRVGGGQNHHAGLNSGHSRAGGRHRAGRGAVRWGRLPGPEGSRGSPSPGWATPGRRPRVPLREGLRMRWMIYLCRGCPPAPAAGQLPLFTRTPPRAKSGFRRMVEGVSTHPQAGGGAVMGKAVDRPGTWAQLRQYTQGECAYVPGRLTALLQSALLPQVKARCRL